MDQDGVRFRLLRDNDVPPTNPFHLAYRFGLQDTSGNLAARTQLPDGAISFDFLVKVKQGKDCEHPVLTGLFASGPLGTASSICRGGPWKMASGSIA